MFFIFNFHWRAVISENTKYSRYFYSWAIEVCIHNVCISRFLSFCSRKSPGWYAFYAVTQTYTNTSVTKCTIENYIKLSAISLNKRERQNRKLYNWTILFIEFVNAKTLINLFFAIRSVFCLFDEFISFFYFLFF